MCRIRLPLLTTYLLSFSWHYGNHMWTEPTARRLVAHVFMIFQVVALLMCVVFYCKATPTLPWASSTCESQMVKCKVTPTSKMQHCA